MAERICELPESATPPFPASEFRERFPGWRLLLYTTFSTILMQHPDGFVALLNRQGDQIVSVRFLAEPTMEPDPKFVELIGRVLQPGVPIDAALQSLQLLETPSPDANCRLFRTMTGAILCVTLDDAQRATGFRFATSSADSTLS